MSKRDTEIALKQILSHAREATEICQGEVRSDLDSDRLLNLALTRLIEIIGEAANRVPGSIIDFAAGKHLREKRSLTLK
jgi:uncharacterized protein with HEPN domain